MIFKPDGLPKRMRLVHKFAYGRVDLEFSGWGRRLGELRGMLGSAIPKQASLTLAGKSAALRIPVPRVSAAASPETQRPAIEVGVLAAVQLLEWQRAHASALSDFESGPA